MLTPQQKIDEIHSILVKMEARQRRKNIFSWTKRILLIAFLMIVVFFPNALFNAMVAIFTPIIEQSTKQIIESQKENFSQIQKNIIEKAKNFYQ